MKKIDKLREHVLFHIYRYGDHSIIELLRKKTLERIINEVNKKVLEGEKECGYETYDQLCTHKKDCAFWTEFPNYGHEYFCKLKDK